MPIKVTYKSNITQSESLNLDAVASDVIKTAEMMHSDILDCLILACLDVVREARQLPNSPPESRHQPHQPYYIDDSGVLRSSIGFVIYDHGKPYFSNFAGVGAEEGKNTAESVAQKYPNDIVAVIAAGAMYAAAVEGRGYYVLSNSANKLGDIFNQKLQRIMPKK